MSTVSRQGFRFNSNVARDVAKAKGVDKDTLLDTAMLHDNGNRYLARDELMKSADTINSSQHYEKLLAMPEAEFERAARVEVRANNVPQLASLRFDRDVNSAPVNDNAKLRDKRMDMVANEVADILNARRGWKVTVEGAKGDDVLAGALPADYNRGPGARDFGEVYNTLKIKIPGVGTETLALIQHRFFNDFTFDGRPSTYVQDEAELQLAFMNPRTKKLYGSGYTLDGNDGDWWADNGNVSASARELFSETNAGKLKQMVESLAEEIVDNLDDFKALND